MKLRMTLAAALLASLVFPAAASTQASLSLSGFTATLKDLNTGDGLAPSISWTGPTTNSTFSFDEGQQGWSQSGGSWSPVWNSGTELSNFLTSPGNLDQVSLHGHGTQHIATSGAGLDALTVTAHAVAGQYVYSEASMYQSFTLSPGTQVTFSVTIDGSWSGTGYAGPWSPPPGWSGAWNSNSALAVYLGISTINSDWLGYGSAYWQGELSSYDSSIDGQTLKVTIKNMSNVDASYGMGVSAGVNVQELAAPVPEPASYAMLGAGLLLLGAVTRRPQTAKR